MWGRPVVELKLLRPVPQPQGGSVLAQDQATSTVWGMPGAVAQAGLAYKVLPLAAIAAEILRVTAQAAAPTEIRSLARRMV